MKRILWLLLFLFVLARPALAADTTRFIVKYKSTTSSTLRERLRARFSARIQQLRLNRLQVLEVSRDRAESVKQSLLASDLVEYVEEDASLEALATVSDPKFSDQWNLSKINTATAWDISQSGPHVQIAILDSGINKNHQDLVNKVVAEANFTTESTTDDRYGHGTHVAGIAAAVTNNSIGVAGVGYNAQLMSGKILDRRGRGYYSWLINALIWAADSGAEIINMSVGGTATSQALSEAIDYASNKGVVLVAAAGNSGSSTPSYPAAYPVVLAVAASDKSDQKPSFSNWGSWVDVAAPGTSILSLDKSGGYITKTGTSMAAPHVSGIAALLWGTQWGSSAPAVVDRIQTTSLRTPATGQYWQFGRVDAAAALGFTPAPIPSPSPSPSPSPIPSPSPSPSPLSSWCIRYPWLSRCSP